MKLGRERNVLFNDALNTFYLRLYGVSEARDDHKFQNIVKLYINPITIKNTMTPTKISKLNLLRLVDEHKCL